jgi:hypothetical protein
MNDLQRTPEWHADRLGKLTGSHIDEATAKLAKGGWGVSRANYKANLVNERLTGVPTEYPVTKAMQDGIDREGDAITVYEFERNVVVELVGFIPHPRIPLAGCSPDGLVGENGIVSIKCPMPATHQATLKGASINGGYIKQFQWELACTGRQWCDFVSYQPLMPTDLQIDIRRVQRDDKLIEKLEEEAAEFLREVEQEHKLMLSIAAARRVGRAVENVALTQLRASVEALGA